MKKLFAILAALVMLLSLVACGGEDSGEVVEDPVDNVENEQQVEEDLQKEEEKEPEKQLEPIVYTGSGDDVIEIGSIEDGYVFHITGNKGSDMFIVTSYDADGNEVAMLVCESEPYDGVTTDWDLTSTTLEIEADGEWTVKLVPTANLPHYNQGDTITGNGDFVFYADSVGKTADISGNAGSDMFIITTWGDGGDDMPVCEAEPYEGKVMLKNDPYFFVVEATGEWSIKLN